MRYLTLFALYFIGVYAPLLFSLDATKLSSVNMKCKPNVGPQGPTGPQGPPGTGFPGPRGPQGPTGPQGTLPVVPGFNVFASAYGSPEVSQGQTVNGDGISSILIDFDTEQFNPQGISHAPADSFIILTDGIYLINWSVEVQYGLPSGVTSSNFSTISAELVFNPTLGEVQLPSTEVATISSLPLQKTLNGSGTFQLAANTIVSVQAFYNSGVTNVSGDNGVATYYHGMISLLKIVEM